MFSLRRLLQLSALSGAAVFMPTVMVEAQDVEYEVPPILSAKDLLGKADLKGPYHKVADEVTNDGYFNNYVLESKFGKETIEGQQLLDIRIGELIALVELDKMSSSKVVGDSAYEGGKAIVQAPVKAVGKVVDTVSDPQKVKDTVTGIPDGAERLFSWAYRQAKSGVQAVGDVISPSGTPEPDSGYSAGGALNAGKDLGLKYIGYSSRERDLFKLLKCNPYTTNKLVQSEVSRIVSLQTTVGVAFRFVPGLGLLSQLDTFNTWYDRAQQLSLYEEPEEIFKKNKAELMKLGVTEENTLAFLRSKVYNPWTQRFISNSLTQIGPKVSGHNEFIKMANTADNEPTTLYFVSVAEAMEKLHKRRPLRKIVTSLYIPAAVTRDGLLYVPLSVDYLFWTQEVAGIFEDFKKRVLAEEKFSSAEVRIRGKASPLARRKLEALGAKVVTGGLS